MANRRVEENMCNAYINQEFITRLYEELLLQISKKKTHTHTHTNQQETETGTSQIRISKWQ